MKYRSLITAIIQTSALFVAGIVIPVIGQIAVLFAPVPLVLVYLRNDKQQGFIALAASCLLVGLLGGWESAAILFFSFGLMAIGIAEGMRRQWKPEEVSLLGGLLPVVVAAAAIALYFLRVQKNPVTVIEEYLRSSMAEAAKLYTQMGFSEMSTRISMVSDKFIHHLVRLLPGISVATSVFQAAVCYGLARSILSRAPGNAILPARVSLAQWHAPDVWVWGLIAGLALIMVPDETARYTGWNIAIVYAVIYLVQGVAIVDHYLAKARIRPFMRGVLHTLILALPSIVFVIALGVVDIWADLRKVRVPVSVK
jgi:uncharacterized protein YybS (DUF2232 family)